MLDHCNAGHYGDRDLVRAACAEVLSCYRSEKSLSLIARELQQIADKTEGLEFGSQLAAAIKAIGSPAGADALEKYAQPLDAARIDNPLRRRYLDQKAAEARRIADEIRIQQSAAWEPTPRFADPSQEGNKKSSPPRAFSGCRIAVFPPFFLRTACSNGLFDIFIP